MGSRKTETCLGISILTFSVILLFLVVDTKRKPLQHVHSDDEDGEIPAKGDK